MTIEFQCHECGRAMRAPDGAAGKQGKCPQCGTLMEIPSPEPEAPRAVATADGKIEFPCPSCSAPVRTPAAAAGKRGKCPHCGDIMQIPTVVDEPAEEEAAEEPSAPAPKATKSSGEVVEFACPNCQNKMRAPAGMAGKNGKCPRCQNVVKIPGSGAADRGLKPLPSAQPAAAAPSKPAAAAKSAAPLPMVSGLRPISAPASPTPTAGLTPLTPVAGLTPLAPASGLTPLAPTAGLTPLAPADGLTPLGAGGAPNPFGDFGGGAGMGGTNPWGGSMGGAAGFAPAPAGPANPYAAPGMGAYSGARPAVSTYGGTASGAMEFGPAFSRTWALMSENLGQAALFGLSLCAMFGAFFFGTRLVTSILGWFRLGIVGLVFELVGFLLLIVVLICWPACVSYAALRCARTGRFDIKDLRQGMRYVPAFFGMQIVANIAAGLPGGIGFGIGFAFLYLGIDVFSPLMFLLCVCLGWLAGAFIALKLVLAPTYVMDGRANFGDAIGKSWNAMTSWNVLIYAVTMFCTVLLGYFASAFTCGVGGLWLLPLIFLMNAVLYQQVADSRGQA